VHGAGQLVLAVNFPEQYREILEYSKRDQIPLIQAERQRLEVTHAEVGAYLMGIWGLPHPIIEALAYNCAPSAGVGREFSPLTALHVACRFDLARRDSEAGLPVPPLDLEYLKAAGLEGRLEAWHKVCEDTLASPEESRDGKNTICR